MNPHQEINQAVLKLDMANLTELERDWLHQLRGLATRLAWTQQIREKKIREIESLEMGNHQ